MTQTRTTATPHAPGQPVLTTRLVTLARPGDALDGLLEAAHQACGPGESTTVGRTETMPPWPGQPAGGHAVVEYETPAGAVQRHLRFTMAAGKALGDCGIPYAWQTGDGQWHTTGGAGR